MRAIRQRGADPVVVLDYRHIQEDQRHPPTFARELRVLAARYSEAARLLQVELEAARTASVTCIEWAAELEGGAALAPGVRAGPRRQARS